MTELTVANYIFYKIPLKFRIALSRMRCSAHDLNSEIGRHDSIPHGHRICYLRNSSATEDEFHFIMICSVYDEIRHKYMPQLDNTVKNVTVFSRLMNSGETTTQN